MRINTIELDGNTLSSHKEVEIGSKQFTTPAKALQVGKLRSTENVSSLTRGIAEIYTKANAAALENSRSGWTGLAKKLERQAKNAQDGELVIPFLEYDDTSDLEPKNAAEIAKLQTNYGDFITVPLMIPLVNAADDGDDRSSSHVSTIIQNTQTFLNAVDELGIGKPVMGVIPPISEDCTQALTELYAESGLRAYCVDFNRRSPMAQAQINHVVNPLMQTLTGYDLGEESIVYAVNARNSRQAAGNRRTADAMYAYTLGFDIVGDNHIPPNWPEEVFKKIAEQSEDGKVELRLFDANTVSIVEVPVDDLASFLPDTAEISVNRVQKRIASNPDEQYRFEKLINSELISLYLESEGGVDPSEIFIELSSTEYAQETDLKRVHNLISEVRDT
ncbi:hypothetical protein [Natronorubrum thiooxidans]|uniref:Uncharacterized protein n=1 Tax=Natronorubrum thiooxidans TaxID=308853 RepID=A0A1N7H4G8_9EURY|nr:hypothetical protein [Natronorubrum thiooxidans]SIS19719.1 hypothetical protein SAMN05421752_12417 [Natronorubrum thiooxidans]